MPPRDSRSRSITQHAGEKEGNGCLKREATPSSGGAAVSEPILRLPALTLRILWRYWPQLMALWVARHHRQPASQRTRRDDRPAEHARRPVDPVARRAAEARHHRRIVRDRATRSSVARCGGARPRRASRCRRRPANRHPAGFASRAHADAGAVLRLLRRLGLPPATRCGIIRSCRSISSWQARAAVFCRFPEAPGCSSPWPWPGSCGGSRSSC